MTSTFTFFLTAVKNSKNVSTEKFLRESPQAHLAISSDFFFLVFFCFVLILFACLFLILIGDCFKLPCQWFTVSIFGRIVHINEILYSSEMVFFNIICLLTKVFFINLFIICYYFYVAMGNKVLIKSFFHLFNLWRSKDSCIYLQALKSWFLL